MATAYFDWSEYAPREFTGAAVTVGNFDGVHRGHQALVAAARRHADSVRGPVVVVTFDPPPHQVLHPGSERPPLTTIAQRSELLHAIGADHVVVLRTSPALLALSPEAFFEDVIVRQLGAKALVEGYDFRFGRGRAGTNETLKALCADARLEFTAIPQYAVGGEPVSSSRVRAALVNGDVSRAAELLNRPYRITGTVVTGAKRGRTIGFPTANLDNVLTVLPGNGVFAVRAIVGGATHQAAANIGPNPTFGEDARKIEVHLIGFAGDLYGKEMSVEFVARLRETKPFKGVSELIEQLKQDVTRAQEVLSTEPKTRAEL
ncbi:bifunctional riboflavin kinase/FAD synthetase [Gemmata sp. G18]|uniref:Riboflavin biosynthesis protein n=1 Tax=Gemmata palustris TaxID=2822762 RepID=A0ABS5BZQ6_9BACT|nr:bifunctional riboflavin kinase/FAD synthetase [Gemmata palustris]MBP3959212.1 bifunctional riboflavin kinase/FAD synthetase [Gemmata palustris]